MFNSPPRRPRPARRLRQLAARTPLAAMACMFVPAQACVDYSPPAQRRASPPEECNPVPGRHTLI
eukprot:scaffold751_cov395-Prasinococcus_capsulatus_cf.AAC.4